MHFHSGAQDCPCRGGCGAGGFRRAIRRRPALRRASSALARAKAKRWFSCPAGAWDAGYMGGPTEAQARASYRGHLNQSQGSRPEHRAGGRRHPPHAGGRRGGSNHGPRPAAGPRGSTHSAIAWPGPSPPSNRGQADQAEKQKRDLEPPGPKPRDRTTHRTASH